MTLNIQLLFPLLITSIITMFGWFILHKLGQKRDLENKRKDLRITYLIEAWKKLEYASNRELNELEFIEYIENSIALIQLFGTTNQIILAKNIADDMKKNYDNELRFNIRRLKR
ncbi:hypothetical protein [Flavobacterium lipolyticum]|uniref:Uncharacterized protein n=1 Tax=Flavobacterium lipolyticum TaxID=2893754 RepID=A0ABS8LZH7_9FLAO|nr:hypothetical protein [Flavobacterium sp. F-126]MCC9017333.1 hypothetical protein [Flavobacterium sp. F-126]